MYYHVKTLMEFITIICIVKKEVVYFKLRLMPENKNDFLGRLYSVFLIFYPQHYLCCSWKRQNFGCSW